MRLLRALHDCSFRRFWKRMIWLATHSGDLASVICDARSVALEPGSWLAYIPRFMSNGFKEWTLICDALGAGTQSIILRKGGIAEGRAGFRFAHDDFLLFPTLFHEQVQKLKLPPETALSAPAEGEIEIRYRAKVEWTLELSDFDSLPNLAPFHLWRDEVVEERFRYDEKQAISLAFVRVYRLEPAFLFPDAPRYGGCRSWVTLPDVPADTSKSLPKTRLAGCDQIAG